MVSALGFNACCFSCAGLMANPCSHATVTPFVRLVELGGMTKNLYHGIFLNYTGFTVYDGIYFFHA